MRQIGYQLYSSRAFPPVAGTLRLLAELGYTQVEGYGALLDGDIPGLATGLAAAGLTMPTCHIDLDQLEARPANVLSIAGVLGLQTAVIPFLSADQRPTDAPGWAALGARVARAGAPLRAAGLALAWHNHDFELRPLPDGSAPFNHLLAADPDLLVELDLGWVAAIGGDPLAWIDRLSARLHAVHLKDRAVGAEEDGWADVGHGTLDWRAILARLAHTTAEHLIVEHDCPASDRRFAMRSIAYLRQLSEATP